jgi:DNA-binding NtrC family response regulator/predicted hydrocarbon binding protein
VTARKPKRSKKHPPPPASRASTEPARTPDIDDLRALFRFLPEDGRIWLGNVRMALIHVSALAALRRELIDRFGVDTARGLLTRMGYESGSRDAELARRARPDASFSEAFFVGPQVHSLEGMVHVESLRFELDSAKGHLHAEALWRNSAEVDCHLSTYGISAEPVCWMQIGYACAYTTAFVGRPMLVREVECRAAGAANCRIVVKPVEEWGDSLDDLRFLQSEEFLRHTPPGLGEERRPLTVSLPKPAVSELSDELVGASSAFNAACQKLRRVADTSATVLFLGETGVGKEMFARTLHRVSDRAGGPFVAVNCAAIPETLIESELFGVEKGAFTGAVASRPGRFERADGGTLFLDEVGTLNLQAQAKLLRALQTGEVERVGDVRVRKLDVRVVAATNEDLEQRVRQGAFRGDLFYRLNVFPIAIPPLRERRDDLPLLMRHLLEKYSTRHRRKIPGYTERAISALLDYDYPGNIREMENMIERAVILSENDRPLDVYLLFPSGRPADRGRLAMDPEGRLRRLPEGGGAFADLSQIAGGLLDRGVAVEEVVTWIMRQAAERAGGNLTAAAKMVGVTRAQLAYRLKKDRARRVASA